MEKINTIINSITYIGVADKTIDLFEGQYPVANGITYNSYVIMDDKIAIMDTVDLRANDTWFKNLEQALQGKTPDYLVVSHMEPDHSANIKALIDLYPTIKIVGNAKTFTMIEQFFHESYTSQQVLVKEGDTLKLGHHTLKFMMAPMVHWPEVMMSYDIEHKILFSADAFGKFGTLDYEDNWVDEARRYYINIVGKYGMQVQALLKKAVAFDIQQIYPLHGPILDAPLDKYLDLYQTWSRYEAEESGVMIAYASIYGNTKKAIELLASLLKEKNQKVVCYDLSRTEPSLALSEAFHYDRVVFASPSYDGGVFTPMENFLHRLKAKNFQNKKVACIENGTWAPSANKTMLSFLETMKNIEILEPKISIRSSLSDKNKEEIKELVEMLINERRK